MKIFKYFVIPVLLITLQLSLPLILQSSAGLHQATSSVFNLTEFNAAEVDNQIHIETNNHGVSLLDSTIEDKGISLLDAEVEDAGTPLLDVMLHDYGSTFSNSAISRGENKQ